MATTRYRDPIERDTLPEHDRVKAVGRIVAEALEDSVERAASPGTAQIITDAARELRAFLGLPARPDPSANGHEPHSTRDPLLADMAHGGTHGDRERG